jgi:phosphatidylinositol alpha-mannosyltransferase
VRVAIVCPYDLGAPGGVQDQVIKLRSWLQEEDHESWVVAPGPEAGESVSVGRARVVPANGSRAPIGISPRIVARLAAAVGDADVVHVHEPLMPVVSLAATLRHRRPTVGTFHADPPRWVRAAYRRVFGATGGKVGRLDVVTAVSPVAAAALRGVVGVRIVPNGLEVDAFATGPKVPGRVAFLGRDDPRKGLDVFVEAARVAAGDARFVAAGPLRRPVPGAVEHVGRLAEAEKRAFLAAADVFVAPHRGGESFGMVVVEAMAAGCAVVASALPAFAHVLGDAGVLVPPGDATAVAREVGLLLEDDGRRTALQDAARRRVRRFDRSEVLALYLDSYRAALLG